MKKTLMAGFLGVAFLICGMTAQAENIAANATVRAESGFYDHCADNVADGDPATECSIGTGWGTMAFFFSWDNWVNIGEINVDLSSGNATHFSVDAYKDDGSYDKWLGNANSASGLTANVAHLLKPGAEIRVGVATTDSSLEMATAEIYINNYTVPEIDAMIRNIELTPGPQGPQGKQGADGAAGAAGADGAAGAAGADGAAAPCVSCADVAGAAVDLACKIMGGSPPSSVQELEDCARVIVNSLQISANICETDCDIGAEINNAIQAKD